VAPALKAEELARARPVSCPIASNNAASQSDQADLVKERMFRRVSKSLKNNMPAFDHKKVTSKFQGLDMRRTVVVGGLVTHLVF
jgi:hypothetical protein